MAEAKLTQTEVQELVNRGGFRHYTGDSNVPAVYVVNPSSFSGSVNVGDVGIENVAGTKINPATSELQSELRDQQVLFLPVQYGTGADTDPIGVGVYLYDRNGATSSRLAVLDAAGAVVAAPTNVRIASAGSSGGAGQTVTVGAGTIDANTTRIATATDDLLVQALGGTPATADPAGTAREQLRAIAENTAATTDFEFTDWQVTTAHAGLTVDQLVRERVTATGVTWTLLSGNTETALPGADPTYANLVRVGGSAAQTDASLITERFIEIPTEGDAAVGTETATQYLRPAAPDGTTTFFSGPNTLPANTDWVSLTIGQDPEFLQSASDSQAQAEEVLTIAQWTAFVTAIAGQVPTATDGEKINGRVLQAGYTYVFSATEITELRILANATSGASPNQRAYAEVRFYSGPAPDIRAWQSYRPQTDLLLGNTLSGGGTTDSQLTLGTPSEIDTNTGLAVDTWIQVVPDQANRTAWLLQVPTDAADYVEVGVGADGAEVRLARVPAGSSLGQSAGDLPVDTGRLVVRSPSVSIPVIGHVYLA